MVGKRDPVLRMSEPVGKMTPFYVNVAQVSLGLLERNIMAYILATLTPGKEEKS